MAKTDLTEKLEQQLWKNTRKIGVFGCLEVTIGYYGKERVDYLTCDTKGTWRCYEIKVSKADFHSKSKKTFVGHYNYYVMPQELYEEVKDEIPAHIGVHIGTRCIKNPKKQELAVDEQVLKDSMIRSLSRENEKFIRTKDNKYLTRLKSQVSRLEKELYQERGKRYKYQNAIYDICNKYNLNYDEVRKLIKE